MNAHPSEGAEILRL